MKQDSVRRFGSFSNWKQQFNLFKDHNSGSTISIFTLETNPIKKSDIEREAFDGGEILSCYTPALNVEPNCSLTPLAVNFNGFNHHSWLVLETVRGCTLNSNCFPLPSNVLRLQKEHLTRWKRNWWLKATSSLSKIWRWNSNWKRLFKNAISQECHFAFLLVVTQCPPSQYLFPSVIPFLVFLMQCNTANPILTYIDKVISHS